jgi:hypothetical protein
MSLPYKEVIHGHSCRVECRASDPKGNAAGGGLPDRTRRRNGYAGVSVAWWASAKTVNDRRSRTVDVNDVRRNAVTTIWRTNAKPDGTESRLGHPAPKRTKIDRYRPRNVVVILIEDLEPDAKLIRHRILPHTNRSHILIAKDVCVQ